MRRDSGCLRKGTWVIGKARFLAIVALAGLLSAIPGCRETGPRLWNVRGLVRFGDGEPVTSGIVEFSPREGGPIARSRIAADGTFSLETNHQPGAVSGRHRVVVVQLQATVAPEGHLAHEKGKTRVATHHANFNTSEIELEVAANHENQLEVVVDRADKR